MGICPSADGGSIRCPSADGQSELQISAANAGAKTAGMHVSQLMDLRACVRGSFFEFYFQADFISKSLPSLISSINNSANCSPAGGISYLSVKYIDFESSILSVRVE